MSVTVENTIPSLTVDLDLLAAPDPESDGPLEVVVKVVLLPVLDVVRELDFSIKPQVHIVQEAQIELLTDHVGRALLQVNSTSVVGLLESPQQVRRDVVGVILGSPDSHPVAILGLAATPLVLVVLLGRTTGFQTRCDGGAEGQCFASYGSGGSQRRR